MSSGDFIEETQSTDESSYVYPPTASEGSWQPTDDKDDFQDQQQQVPDDYFPAQGSNGGLTQQRLGESQIGLNWADGTVDTWDGPYNPINSQVLTAAEVHDGYESSSSTIHQPSEQGSSRALEYVWPTDIDRPGQQAHIYCRDFVDEICERILLVGESSAIENLRQWTAVSINRQWTPAAHQLCALFALQISLQSTFAQCPDIHSSFSFTSLLSILRSPGYYDMASGLLRTAGDHSSQARDELLLENNLSVNAIFIILQLLGRKLGRSFALGICALVRGSSEPTYTVYRLCPEDLSHVTVWLYNDRFDQDGTGISHWSGFGTNIHVAHEMVVEPRIQLNSGHIGIFDRGQENHPSLGLSQASSPSPYLFAETSLTSMSRTPSIEQGHNVRSRNMLSPFEGANLRRTLSHSSGHSSSKDMVNCQECGKAVQRRGLK